MGKIFVKITAEHDTNGTVRPLIKPPCEGDFWYSWWLPP